MQIGFIFIITKTISYLSGIDVRILTNNTFKIVIIITLLFTLWELSQWTEYVCANVDLGIHINIVRIFSNLEKIDFFTMCPRLENFNEAHYLAGYFNGTYETKPHEILSQISIWTGISPTTLVITTTTISYLINLFLSFYIIKKFFGTNNLIILVSILWSFENPKYFVMNGWFTHSIMTNMILIVLYSTFYYIGRYKKTKSRDYLLIPILGAGFTLFFIEYFAYDIITLIRNPDRLLNNTVDIYRLFYTFNFLFTPFIALVIWRIFTIVVRKIKTAEIF